MSITYASATITITGGKDTGTATSGAATTITDTSKSWTTNAYAGRFVWITTGTGAGQRRRIVSNTGTALTVNYAWTTNPASGSTYVITFNFQDVKDADTAGSWGVVTKTGDYQYSIAAAFLIGDGSTYTGFGDCSQQVQFTTYKTPGRASTSRTGWNGGIASNAIAIFGEQTSAAKASQKGCMLYYNMTSGFIEFLVVNGTGILDFHSSNISGKNQGYFGSIGTSSGAKVSAYNSLINADCGIYNASGLAIADLYKCVVSGDNIASSIGIRGDGSIIGCSVFHTTISMLGNSYPAINVTYRDLYGRSITNIFRTDANSTTQNFYLINVDSDSWSIQYNDTNWTGYLYRQWAVNYSVIGGTTGFRFALFNNAGTSVFNTTNTAATLAEQIVSEGYFKKSNGQTFTSYNAHSLRIRQYGYQFVLRALTITANITEGITPVVNSFVVANYATAWAYTGAAIVGSTNTTTLSGARTMQSLYDYSQALGVQEGNMQYSEQLTTTNGTDFTLITGGTIIAAQYLDFGTKRLAGGTIRYTATGTYSPRVGVITIDFSQAGTYSLAGGDFGGQVTFTNSSDGAVTVELAAGVDYVNTGPNITIDEPQIYQSVVATGYDAGTRIQIYDVTSSTELYIGTPTFPYTWTDSTPYVSDRTIRIRDMYKSGTDATIFGDRIIGTVTSTNPSITYTASQEDDNVYTLNGVEGGTVTGITINDAGMILEIDSGTVSTISGVQVILVDVKNLYAYETHWLSTNAGMRDEGRFIDAIDGANYEFDSFKIRNDSGYPVVIIGGYVRDKATGKCFTLTDYSGYSISYAPDHVVNNIITVSGSSVITGDIDDVTAKVQAGMTAQGYTTARGAALDGLATETNATKNRNAIIGAP